MVTYITLYVVWLGWWSFSTIFSFKVFAFFSPYSGHGQFEQALNKAVYVGSSGLRWNSVICDDQTETYIYNKKFY